MPRTASWWSKECLPPRRKIGRQCAAVSVSSRRRSRADVRVSPPLLSSSPLSSRLLSSPPCAPPLLDAPHLSSRCRSASRRRQLESRRRCSLLSSTLLLIASLLSSPPLLWLLPLLSRRTPLLYTVPLLDATPLDVVPLSPLRLSSPRCHTSSPTLPLLIRPRLRPRHSHRIRCICIRTFCVGLTRLPCVCVLGRERSTM